MKSIHVVLIISLLISPYNSLFNKENPILWREVDSPVVKDVIEVTQDIMYVSPCYLINNATVDPANMEYLTTWCEDLFETDFMKPFRSFCSQRDSTAPLRNLTLARDPSLLLRQKRFFPLLLPLAIPAATLIKGAALSIVSIIGITFGAFSIAKHDSHGRFRDEMTKEMEKRREDHEQLRNLMNQFAFDHQIMNERMNKLERRVNQFIEYYPSATTLVADISSRLGHLRAELKVVGEQWKKGKVDPTLFTILSVTLDDDMDVTRAIPLSCALDEQKRIYSLRFRIPVRDPSSSLLRADPFSLLTFPHNDSMACSLKYTGPAFAVYNNMSRCVYPLFGTDDLEDHIVYFPSTNSCLSLPDTGFQKYFASNGCKLDRNLYSPADTVQVKSTRDNNLIYCSGSMITYDHITRACPDFVFSLPPSSNFSAGHVNYRFKQVYWQRESRFLAEQNHKINSILMPDLDLLSPVSNIWNLEKDIHSALHHTSSSEPVSSTLWIIILSLSFCILLLLSFFVYLKYRFFQNSNLTQGLLKEMRSLREGDESEP